MIDFDCIQDWEESFTECLDPYAPASIREQIAASNPKYVEDARDTLFRLAGRRRVIDAAIAWITASHVCGYHGSRLTPGEVESIRARGLLPLTAESRRARLERALGSHPRWNQVQQSLADALQAHGQGERAGRRENQVHLTLSRCGLVNSFNHYLTHGSEFDQHVAQSLLGDEGYELLGRDGRPFLVHVRVPGAAAIAAAHPYFSLEDTISRNSAPNIIGEFLETWSFRIANPDFQPASLEIDCGMVFRSGSSVPGEWITEIEEISDTALSD